MRNLLLILFAVFLTNCKSDDNTNTTYDREIFEILAVGAFTGDNITATAQNNVIKAQADWNNLVSLLATQHHDLSGVAINFNQENIVFVRDKPRPNRKYSIIVDKVLYTSTEVKVYIKSEVSEFGQDSPSQPFCVAKISKTNLPVNFY